MELNDLQKRDIFNYIKDRMPKMSKGHRAIAEYIFEHYEQAVFMTAAQISAEVGVSESTVVRFAVNLGFDGFPNFQKHLAVWMKDQFSSVSKVGAKYGQSSQSEIVRSVLNSDIERIQDTIGSLDGESFEVAVDILLHARTVYVIGLRSCEPLAEFFGFYLQMIRGNVVILKSTSATEVFEQMIRIGDQDAIVGISFPRYSMRTLKAMQFASDRNARVIAVTDSLHSPMNLYSSCNLIARSDSISIVDSLVAPLSLLNALVVAMCIKRPNDIRKNLKDLEYAWSNYQVYLNDEINFIDDDVMNDSSLWRKDR